ncbi:biotin transport system substrate-specific component [Marininema mesophilum]|uniref:Biotin transporter n=1 Tax=Marininema mesophilum TaxID=1048340 RepID=A0A1H3CC53_9BACL|nr:biotin transporter BioY [Marininema mesophilum]SDX51737.1 biotin transport system substrate-specific component [Marininema mesophilum]
MSTRKQPIRDMMLIALFTALTAIAGQIYIPLTMVPINLQTMIVLLAGSILGARRGAMSMVVLILLVVVGAPVLSEGKSGLPALVGPTAGYIWSWPIVAFLIGWLTERMAPKLRFWKMVVVHFFAGSVIIFAFGVSWLHFSTGLGWNQAIAVGLLPFIPGDLAKLLVASFLVPVLYRAYPLIQAHTIHK